MIPRFRDIVKRDSSSAGPVEANDIYSLLECMMRCAEKVGEKSGRFQIEIEIDDVLGMIRGPTVHDKIWLDFNQKSIASIDFDKKFTVYEDIDQASIDLASRFIEYFNQILLFYTNPCCITHRNLFGQGLGIRWNETKFWHLQTRDASIAIDFCPWCGKKMPEIYAEKISK